MGIPAPDLVRDPAGRVLVAVDTETGGFDAATHALVALACSTIPRDGRQRGRTFSCLVEPGPGLVVEQGAAAVNGYSPRAWSRGTGPEIDGRSLAAWGDGLPPSYLPWKEAMGAPARAGTGAIPERPAIGLFAAFLRQFAEGVCLVAHNLPFDRRFLAAAAHRHPIAVPGLTGSGYCTMGTMRTVRSRRLLPLPAGSAKLQDSHRALLGRPHGDAHTAWGDVAAVVAIVRVLVGHGIALVAG